MEIAGRSGLNKNGSGFIEGKDEEAGSLNAVPWGHEGYE